MFVVADQAAVRVGGQRGLAGAGQAEEQRGFAVAADIGAAMHRQHAAAGQFQFITVKIDFLISPAYSCRR
jgi:hypothetical protein